MDPTFKQQLRLLKRWCFLRFSGSCHISIMVSCKSRCTPLRCSAAYQTPLKSCTRGSCFWGFFPQHTPYATGRRDGAQITVAASLLHGLSSSRIGITNIKILDWVQYSELFFTSPIFQPQGKIPAGFTSTMRKPRSSRFTLKFNLKCKPKSYWGKKKKKKKHNATEYSLLEENKQINKKSTAQLHAARPGPPLHTRTRVPSTSVSSLLVPEQSPADLCTSRTCAPEPPSARQNSPFAAPKTKLCFLPSTLLGVTTTKSSKIGF